MSEPECPYTEDEVAAVLAAYDDALAAGVVPSLACSEQVAAEVRRRLEKSLATLRTLHRSFPPPTGARTAAGGSPASLEVATVPFARLGRFHVRRELGRGAAGVVVLAHDPQLCRDVALKVPYGESLLLPERRERFLREAQAAAALDHPNVVPLFEAGAVGPLCYTASAYCPGGTLADWLRRQAAPVPERIAAGLTALIAGAVQHAHERGVLHRDLKPGNILLQPAPSVGLHETSLLPPDFGFVPRITDFGMAKLQVRAQPDRTLQGVILGTPAYMAPEQAAGKSEEITPAADVYALGAILYELLTGGPPFRADSVTELLAQVQARAPTPPGQLRHDLDASLEAICLKCLQKDPAARYGSAAVLAKDLGCFLAGRAIPGIAPASPSGPASAGSGALTRPLIDDPAGRI